MYPAFEVVLPNQAYDWVIGVVYLPSMIVVSVWYICVV